MSQSQSVQSASEITREELIAAFRKIATYIKDNSGPQKVSRDFGYFGQQFRSYAGRVPVGEYTDHVIDSHAGEANIQITETYNLEASGDIDRHVGTIISIREPAFGSSSFMMPIAALDEDSGEISFPDNNDIRDREVKTRLKDDGGQLLLDIAARIPDLAND